MRSLIILTICISNFLISAEASDISQLLDLMGDSEDISTTKKSGKVSYKPLKEINAQNLTNLSASDVSEKNNSVEASKGFSGIIDELKRPKKSQLFKSSIATPLFSKVSSEEVRNNDIVLRTFVLSNDAFKKLNFPNKTSSLKDLDLFPQVSFSEKTSILYQAETSTLFVENTPEQLDILGVILDTLGVLKSSSDSYEQVVIEAKFVEVSSGTLEELGFQFNFTDGSEFSIMGEDGFILDDDLGRGSNEGTLTIDTVINPNNGLQSFVTNYNNFSEYGLLSDSMRGSFSNPQLPFPKEINLGDSAIQASGPWAALRIADRFNSSPATAILSTSSDTPLDILISSLDQSSGANVLSAPRVVTRSGEEALLRVGELHYYPEVFEGDSSQGTLVNIAYEDFEEVLLGIEMNVIPKVENDKITLQINPSIRELAGWQGYELAPANSIYNHRQLSRTQPYRHNAITAQLPIFKIRQIETEVTLNNGSTIAMGGLISEKILSFEDKVPLLGDIPFMGRLFRNEGSRNIKRNLLIFVTATIVEPNGQVHVSKSFK